MCPIDARCRLHTIEGIRDARCKARPRPDPLSANTGYILEKILDPVVQRYRTPFWSGCVARLPVNFLWPFLDMFLRPGLHHTLIFINMGGAISLPVKDT